MAQVPYFYKDTNLTLPFDTADFLEMQAPAGGVVDSLLFVGIDDAGRKLQDETNPGVDPIIMSIIDASPGSGVEAADVKVATSLLGLDSAVAGDPVSLPATINGGAGGRAEVWVRVTNNAGSGTFTDVSLQRSAILESDL